jgi:hypothetical protein
MDSIEVLNLSNCAPAWLSYPSTLLLPSHNWYTSNRSEKIKEVSVACKDTLTSQVVLFTLASCCNSLIRLLFSLSCSFSRSLADSTLQTTAVNSPQSHLFKQQRQKTTTTHTQASYSLHIHTLTLKCAPFFKSPMSDSPAHKNLSLTLPYYSIHIHMK